MMISPEYYYKITLEGKNQQEILKEIRSLKREMNALKRQLEDPFVKEDRYPTRLTRLMCDRDYLERAIQAYEDAGGKYEPTKAEQKSREFDDGLELMQKLVFEIGGYFAGFETDTFTLDEGNVNVEVSHTFKSPIYYVSEEYTKSEFIEGLRNLHLGEWKKKYEPKGYKVLDGEQWNLTIYYSDGQKPARFSGSNAYPYNFDVLIRFLGAGEAFEDDDDQD